VSTTKELYIHLGTSVYVKPGQIHLLASPQDFKELEVFFSSNFDTLSFTRDEFGLPEQLYVCPKGSMFVRSETGEVTGDK